CQGHLPPRGAPVFVDVGEAAGGGLLPPVLEHPEAQRPLIEGERLRHIPDAEGYMRHPESWHKLFSFFPVRQPCAFAIGNDPWRRHVSGSPCLQAAWEPYAPAGHRGPAQVAGRYWAVSPPSMTSSLPVTKADSSAARYRTP